MDVPPAKELSLRRDVHTSLRLAGDVAKEREGLCKDMEELQEERLRTRFLIRQQKDTNDKLVNGLMEGIEEKDGEIEAWKYELKRISIMLDYIGLPIYALKTMLSMNQNADGTIDKEKIQSDLDDVGSKDGVPSWVLFRRQSEASTAGGDHQTSIIPGILTSQESCLTSDLQKVNDGHRRKRRKSVRQRPSTLKAKHLHKSETLPASSHHLPATCPLSIDGVSDDDIEPSSASPIPPSPHPVDIVEESRINRILASALEGEDVSAEVLKRRIFASTEDISETEITHYASEDEDDEDSGMG
jgi:hypothetical protein